MVLNEDSPEKVWAAYHKTLWNWLSKNPHLNNHDWPGWIRIDEYFDYDCFPCQFTLIKYSIQAEDDEPDEDGAPYRCARCPLESLNCSHPDSLYRLWDQSMNLDERSVIAQTIANMWIVKQ
jgi:hypothetical protein